MVTNIYVVLRSQISGQAKKSVGRATMKRIAFCFGRHCEKANKSAHLFMYNHVTPLPGKCKGSAYCFKFQALSNPNFSKSISLDVLQTRNGEVYSSQVYRKRESLRRRANARNVNFQSL